MAVFGLISYIDLHHYNVFIELPPQDSPYYATIQSLAPFALAPAIFAVLFWGIYFAGTANDSKVYKNPAELTIEEGKLELKWFGVEPTAVTLERSYLEMLHDSPKKMELVFIDMLRKEANKSPYKFTMSPIIVVRGFESFSNLELEITRMCVSRSGAREVAFAFEGTPTSRVMEQLDISLF